MSISARTGVGHRMRGVLGESTRMHEAGGTDVTDEEWRDHEVEIID